MRHFNSVLGMPALLIFAANVVHAETPFQFATTPGKLPKDIIPTLYTVNIVPDLATLKFAGTESIELDVKKTSQSIVLNGLNLGIEGASLQGKGVSVPSLEAQVDTQAQTISFRLNKPIAPGHYQLKLSYHGVINRTGQGFYYDRYPSKNGEKLLLGTKMEPTLARSFIPCWDEPAFRASFKLSVEVPSNFEAVSNTPVIKDEVLDLGMHRVNFDATPKMASYLVVLVAGEFDREMGEQDGVQIGVITTKGKQAGAAYPLEASKELLHYYNQYFGTPYPLPKLDHIASPGGFSGAMENWGGIVYNESRMLYDPAHSPENQKRSSYGIIAHEMAHQWFGDLVTMAWWDNLWLNEGFASWMGTKAVDKLHPEWYVWLGANASRERALTSDVGVWTHPIQQGIATEGEAENAFDAITYSKGQAFLRMLESYLGEAKFRKGIQLYVAKHQYSNTTSADLWNALQQASGKPVAKFASNWTTQAGFPLVKVDAVCENNRTQLHLTQQQFSYDGKIDVTRHWDIPVELVAPDGKSQTLMFDQPDATFSLSGCSDKLELDPNGVGLYRIEYAPNLRKSVLARYDALPAAARLKLVSDTWALVLAQHLPLSEYFSLVDRMGKEPRAALWSDVIDQLRSIDGLLQNSPQRVFARKRAIAILTPKLAELGWDPKDEDSSEQRSLRIHLITVLAELGDEGIVAEGKARFQGFLKDQTSLAPALRGVVAHIAGRYADQATYDALKKLGQSALNSEEKFRYFNALAEALDPKLAEQTLQISLDRQLPPLITNRILDIVAASEHTELVWTFAVEHGDELYQALEPASRNRYFPNLASTASTDKMAGALESYVSAHLPREAKIEAQRTAEHIRLRALQAQYLSEQLQQMSGS